ncbi:hypothetical protein GCM10009001_07150 [Virgibacillus siamensis]|uniref:Uncharacterized protein n=1 Tax=Virgibacillus siamensis TaxID=480071 RepID=A0ABN1FLW9_9BACI
MFKVVPHIFFLAVFPDADCLAKLIINDGAGNILHLINQNQLAGVDQIIHLKKIIFIGDPDVMENVKGIILEKT